MNARVVGERAVAREPLRTWLRLVAFARGAPEPTTCACLVPGHRCAGCASLSPDVRAPGPIPLEAFAWCDRCGSWHSFRSLVWGPSWK